MNILYDCYDENENPIGLICANNCADLLQKNPNVKYVRGIDAVTYRPQWHRVEKEGLFPYMPKVKAHREECSWRYSDFI